MMNNEGIGAQIVVDVAQKADVSSQLADIIVQFLDIWVLASLLITITLTQMFKAIVKHYKNMAFGPSRFQFEAMMIYTAFAVYAGYQVTLKLVVAQDVEKWAYMIGILNVVAYKVLILIAERKKWIRLVGLLKMRKVKEDENGELSLEDTVVFMVKK